MTKNKNLTSAVRHKLSRLFFKEIRVEVGQWFVFQVMENIFVDWNKSQENGKSFLGSGVFFFHLLPGTSNATTRE